MYINCIFPKKKLDKTAIGNKQNKAVVKNK